MPLGMKMIVRKYEGGIRSGMHYREVNDMAHAGGYCCIDRSYLLLQPDIGRRRHAIPGAHLSNAEPVAS